MQGWLARQTGPKTKAPRLRLESWDAKLNNPPPELLTAILRSDLHWGNGPKGLLWIWLCTTPGEVGLCYLLAKVVGSACMNCTETSETFPTKTEGA